MRTDGQDIAGKSLLYEEIAGRVGNLIEQGTYRPGERIPSIRTMSRQMQVSINTVMEAYAHLENKGMVEARPQSGYYVRCRLPEPGAGLPKGNAGQEPVACCVSIDEVPCGSCEAWRILPWCRLAREPRTPTCCRSTS